MSMKLYKYQEDYLKDLPKTAIMTADVGLGKSAMALKHYERYSKGNRLVIVAPASKVRSGDWQQDVRSWLPYMDDKGTAGAGPDYIVISYETFTKMAHRSKLLPTKDTVFVFDEIHYCKTPSSLRGKAFARVAQHVDQWIGLTATPMSNGWHDLANYAIGDNYATTKTQFYRNHVVIVMQRIGSRQFPKISGYYNLHKLHKWWDGISKPLSREGNLDLPQFIDKVSTINLPVKAYEEQKRLASERIAADGELLDSHPKLMAALRKNLVASREDAIRNIFDKTDENIVIFYELNAERDLVKKILEDKQYGRRMLLEQNGHVKSLPSAEAPKPTKNAVLLIQYKSGSAGLNLQYCSVTIFMSPTYSYQDYHQARGRTDRNGQTKTPIFYHLEVASKVDRAVWEALRAKRDFVEKSVDVNEFLS